MINLKFYGFDTNQINKPKSEIKKEFKIFFEENFSLKITTEIFKQCIREE